MEWLLHLPLHSPDFRNVVGGLILGVVEITPDLSGRKNHEI